MGNGNEDWFEQFLNDILISIVAGLACGQLGRAKQPIEDYLAGLKQDQELSSSPLIKVTGVDDDALTFLIRGEFPFFSGAVTAFMRILVKIAKKLQDAPEAFKVDIRDWITVIGDLTFSKSGLFEARLAFGYDISTGTGVFSGAGALKVIPAQIGLDLVLGGLSDRGCMVGLKIESPIAIPLGTTGLGIKAIGGDFAYNFIARLDYKGSPIPSPTAQHYVDWAANAVKDRWKAGPVDQTAVGLGVRCDIVTMADQGRAIKLKDAGIAVLTPGPVFILGGEGYVLMGVATAKGYMAVDIASASIAVGLGAAILVPPKSGDLINGSGQIDAFFSFDDPSLWYVYFGQIKAPISVKVLKGLFGASIFYMVDNHLMAFGGGLSVGWDWSWWKIRLYALVGIEAYNKIGWNPFLLEAYFKLWGELGFQLWFISLALKASASVTGMVANPCKLVFDLDFTIDLPFPIPDIDFTKQISFSDEQPQPPVLSLVLAEAVQTPGSNVVKVEKLGALHPITGRQWLLGTEKAWPDLEIVVPFNCRLEDETASKVVVGPVVSSQNQGGYDIHHELSEVTLQDTINQKEITVHGVWADDQGGKTARLHLLGETPYSWLIPHVTPGSSVTTASQDSLIQNFGWGSPEIFKTEKRFGEMLVKPVQSASLLTEYAPVLQTRVLVCDHFQMRFATTKNAAIHVDTIALFVISSEREPAKINYVIGDTASTVALTAKKVQKLYGEIWLGEVVLPLGGEALDQVWLESGGKTPLLVYAVYYREKRKSVQSSLPKQILMPGKYRLGVKGKSYGTHPDLPRTDDLLWEFSQNFEVVYPDRLRPYIKYATVGDYRIFGKEASAWNPTQYGYGFPHYRSYQGVIHFWVPYMNDIFIGKDALSIHLDYDGKLGSKPPSLIQQVKLSKSQTSSALQAAQDWVAANPGIDLTDEELILPEGIKDSGPVHLSIWYKPPNGLEFRLDEWTAYISAFETFGQHLAWEGKTLLVTYDSNGRTTHPVPATLQVAQATLAKQAKGAARAAAAARKKSGTGTVFAPPLLKLPYPFEIQGPDLPAEYTSVPEGWELPAQLEQYLQPLDDQTGNRFCRFASESGVRFDDGQPGSRSCLNELVSATTVEALQAASGKSYALWLRTPEPVDWRRVTASLKIVHVDMLGGCPVSYPARTPLELKITILPSPDASSAFLVGKFNGRNCCLPGGEYELILEFNPYQSGLWKLSPGKGVLAPETVVLKFMHPYGLSWPQPPQEGGLLIPFQKPKALLAIFWVIPELLVKAEAGSLVSEDFDLLYDALELLPRELALESLYRVLDESRVAYLRRVGRRPTDLMRAKVSASLRQLIADLQPVIRLVQALEQDQLQEMRRGK